MKDKTYMYNDIHSIDIKHFWIKHIGRAHRWAYVLYWTGFYGFIIRSYLSVCIPLVPFKCRLRFSCKKIGCLKPNLWKISKIKCFRKILWKIYLRMRKHRYRTLGLMINFGTVARNLVPILTSHSSEQVTFGSWSILKIYLSKYR